ncbi:hypothetical protein [Streptomyces sp. CAU 1734]|uniref:hypothetical protein n=1 Tax=Streptomyces sp. CAU 1734 TaxID=3140360 RepID=UPI003261266C
MSRRHSTAGWSTAFTAAMTTSVADTALLTAARRLLDTSADPAPLNVNAGFATSKFPLPDGRAARPRLLVDELTAPQWERIEQAIADRPDALSIAGTPAISDLLADPATTARIAVVPQPTDISHTCTCTPARTSPCVHTAAVGLLLAERLRTVPAPLFTLRGRAHHHLRTRLRTTPASRSRPRTPQPAPTPHQRTTAPALAAPAAVPIPAPADLDLTRHQPAPTHTLGEPPGPLPEHTALVTLTADAAHRADRLLNGDPVPHDPDTGTDLVRLTALPHGQHLRSAVMNHLNLDTVGMAHLTLAHTQGGPGGAAAYLYSFTVDRDILHEAQAAIQSLRPAPLATIEIEYNRITDRAVGIQLRYGPDSRWHPYRNPYGIWQPVPGSHADPARAYQAARAAARPDRRTT